MEQLKQLQLRKAQKKKVHSNESYVYNKDMSPAFWNISNLQLLSIYIKL